MTFEAMFDDAAIFPPGSVPLGQAVRAHLAYRDGPLGSLVGPFVVALGDVADLARTIEHAPPATIDLTVTVPSPSEVAAVVDAVRTIGAARLVGLEVAVPDDAEAQTVVPWLRTAVGDVGATVWVEVPRDGRRDRLLHQLADSPFLAKFRTGGARAELYPDEAELASSVVATVGAGVAFKATAGLHRAVRNTDAETGFERHGFLNLLVATDAALEGATQPDVRDWLAERDGDRLAERVKTLSVRARGMFRSFGTCSIDEPVSDLVALGLLPVGARP